MKDHTLFHCQEAAFEDLLRTAQSFYNSRWNPHAVKPRFSRLIVGPSGVGKTHTVSALANALGVALYSIDASNWITIGAPAAQGGGGTWQHICEFIVNNDRGIIFVDELDKVGLSHGADSERMQCLRVELFGLLDRRIPDIKLHTHRFREETKAAMGIVSQRFQRNFMIIGGGAFKEAWHEWSKSAAGHLRGERTHELKHRDLQSILPPELVNRFAAPLVVIHPLKEPDYRKILYRTAAQLPREFACRVVQIGRRELETAEENALGVRWIEGILLQAHVNPRPARVRPAATQDLYARAA